MVSKRQDHKNKIDRINHLIDGSSKEYFGGDPSKGFLLWALELHLDQTDDPPSQEEIIQSVTDGKDDLEIDAYFIDEGSQTIYLFQSKYRNTPGNVSKKDIADFLAAPSRLSNPSFLAKNTNAKILDLAPTFREKVLDGYQIQMIFLTTAVAPKPILSNVQEWTQLPLVLNIGGESIDVAHAAVISDVDDLMLRFETASDEGVNQFDLHLIQDEWHVSSAAGFPCLVATVSAEEIAKVFNTYRYSILRYNPRGPLGNVTVNKDIRGTLENGLERQRWTQWFGQVMALNLREYSRC